MTDLRTDRCRELVAPVTALMGAALECQGGAASAFAEVIESANAVLAIAEKGSFGIPDADYEAWAAGGPDVLHTLIEAGKARDARGVWAAFAHPEFGVHRVAAACAGVAGWTSPVEQA